MYKIIILTLLLSVVSCGKRRRNNTTVSTVTISAVNPQTMYLQCSVIQVTNRCLDHASNQRIGPRFFYYRQCYADYNLCLSRRNL